MNHAKELLSQGNMKTEDIAANVGYESFHSFLRAFKKHTGHTASEYLKNT